MALFLVFFVSLIANAEVLIFQDDFNEFDLSVWKHELTLGGGGNHEFQLYVNSRNNSFVQNGTLHIKPTLTQDNVGKVAMRTGKIDMWGSTPASVCTSPQFNGCLKQANGNDILPPVQSARLRTAESFSFKYGRVEIRAKLPAGDWLWPGLWLMPAHDHYGTWPSSGEIDMMESRGNNADYIFDGSSKGNDMFSSCFHFGPTWNKDTYFAKAKSSVNRNASFADDFHTFGLYWDQNELYTYLDDPSNVVNRLEDYGKKSIWDIGLEANGYDANESFNCYENSSINAPFDQEMYLIFNVAVGGTSVAKSMPTGYFPDDVANKPWRTKDPFPAASFYNKTSEWHPTWTHGEDRVSDKASLQIDSVSVWAFPSVSTWSDNINKVYSSQDFEDAKKSDRLSCSDCSSGTTGTCQDMNSKICYSKVPMNASCFLGTESCSPETVDTQVVVFEDEFESLDLMKWHHEKTIVDGQGYRNSRETSYVNNGSLILQCRNVSAERQDIWGISPASFCTGNYNSGCVGTISAESAELRTAESFSFIYGRVEVKARIPPQNSQQTASIKLKPLYEAYGVTTQSGEMNLANVNRGRISSSFSFGLPGSDAAALNSKSMPLNDSEIHTFGLYWDADVMYTYVDSIVLAVGYNRTHSNLSLFKTGKEGQIWPYAVEKDSPWKSGGLNAPFDQQMYLSIGLSGAEQDNTTFEIESVRIWAFPSESKWVYHSDLKPPMNPLFYDNLTRVVDSKEEDDEFLLFHDDFDTLDFNTWKPEITASSPLDDGTQMFVNSRQSSFVSNGKLHLKPASNPNAHQFVDLWGTNGPSWCTSPFNNGCSRPNAYPIESSSFRTAESFSFMYGRVEVRAKMPQGSSLWPRILLLPQYEMEGSWPLVKQWSMMEGAFDSFGVGVLESDTNDLVSHPLDSPHAWHTFGVYWDPTQLYFYHDNPSNIIRRYVNPPTEPMYLVLRLSIGESYNSRTMAGNRHQMNETSFEIDKVSIWGLKNHTKTHRHRLSEDRDVYNPSTSVETPPKAIDFENSQIVSIVADILKPQKNLALSFRSYLIKLFGISSTTPIWGYRLEGDRISVTAALPSVSKYTMDHPVPEDAEFRLTTLAPLPLQKKAARTSIWVYVLCAGALGFFIRYRLRQHRQQYRRI